MKKFLNLTPHPVVLYGKKGIHTFPPTNIVARIKSNPKIHWNNDIPIFVDHVELDSVLPPENDDILYIVSARTFWNSNRNDLVTPDCTINAAVKDENQKIIGTKRFKAKPNFSLK